MLKTLFGSLATVDPVKRIVFVQGWQEQGDRTGIERVHEFYSEACHGIVNKQ